ncbi:MAG: hypothetical protein QOG00_843 [Pyrinomonadaceae bacterium]|jgi:hypothetical protein|nr:hypothetical protein [Pyrinomonadaceae bacterium]MDQ1610912.1 hypothetical protein [Pyrinomonadaceae bacterium]
MQTSVQECRLILRQLKDVSGITETQLNVTSIEELFAFCVNASPQLIERLHITGHDASGQQHLLSFTFQSSIVNSQKTSE